MKITIEQNNVKISLDIEEKPKLIACSTPNQDNWLKKLFDDSVMNKPLNTMENIVNSGTLDERFPWTETHIKQLKRFKKSNDATLPDISEATGIPEWRINKYYYGGYKTISMSDLLAIQEMMKNE